MFEVFKIVTETGKTTYHLGIWIFILYIIGILLFFVLGYCAKIFIDSFAQTKVNNFITKNQKEIEKFKK